MHPVVYSDTTYLLSHSQSTMVYMQQHLMLLIIQQNETSQVRLLVNIGTIRKHRTNSGVIVTHLTGFNV